MLLCVAGSGLLHLMVQLWHYRGSFLSWYFFGQNGFSILGGIVTGIIVGHLYCRKRGLDFHEFGIICAFGLTVYTIFQRIICFLHGCCSGLPTDSFLGYVFPLDSEAGHTFPGQALHPTQLYTVGGYVFILIWLWHAVKSNLPSRLIYGIFILLMAGERIINELFRFAHNSDIVIVLGSTVITGYMVVAVGLWFYGLAHLVFTSNPVGRLSVRGIL